MRASGEDLFRTQLHTSRNLIVAHEGFFLSSLVLFVPRCPSLPLSLRGVWHGLRSGFRSLKPCQTPMRKLAPLPKPIGPGALSVLHGRSPKKQAPLCLYLRHTRVVPWTVPTHARGSGGEAMDMGKGEGGGVQRWQGQGHGWRWHVSVFCIPGILTAEERAQQGWSGSSPSKEKPNSNRVCHQLGKQPIGHEALKTKIFILI